MAVVRHLVSAFSMDHPRAYVTLLPVSDFRKQQKKNFLIPLPPASVPQYPHLLRWMSCLCFYLRPIPLLVCSPLSSLLHHGHHTSNYLLSPYFFLPFDRLILSNIKHAIMSPILKKKRERNPPLILYCSSATALLLCCFHFVSFYSKGL